MKRKQVLLYLGVVLALLLLVFYSLMGAMTGVYVYDLRPFGGHGKGYMIRRGGEWFHVWYSSPRHALPDVMKLEAERADVRSGIWAMTVTVNYGRPTTIRACASLNPIDIYRFTFGDYRSLGRNPGSP